MNEKSALSASFGKDFKERNIAVLETEDHGSQMGVIETCNSFLCNELDLLERFMFAGCVMEVTTNRIKNANDNKDKLVTGLHQHAINTLKFNLSFTDRSLVKVINCLKSSSTCKIVIFSVEFVRPFTELDELLDSCSSMSLIV